MSFSLYDITIPTTTRALGNLRAVLQKGEAHAADKGYAPEVLLQMRLAPDMLPLIKQVQIATDMAKNAATRLTATEPMTIADDESTFEQLYARIDRVLDYLRAFDADAFEGGEAREVVIQGRGGEMRFRGSDYLLFFVLPNVHFHCTTAYAILRHCGVPLGKLDFMGAAR